MKETWKLLQQSEQNDLMGLYRQHARTELIDLLVGVDFLPSVALDIGCAGGATIQLLKEKYPECHAIGFEPNLKAATLAERVADQVVSDVFKLEGLKALGVREKSIDLVILADVLVQTYDPWSILVELQGFLSENAIILVSLPNIRNLSLIDALAAGHWQYNGSGLLDITNIRFFTYRSMLEMFDETGFSVLNTSRVLDSEANTAAAKGKASDTRVMSSTVSIANLSEKDWQELTAKKFLFLLTPKGSDLESNWVGQLVTLKDAATEAHEKEKNAINAAKHYHQFNLLRSLNLSNEKDWALQSLSAWQHLPEVHLVLLALPGTEAWLEDTFASFSSQVYPSWRLTCVGVTPPLLELPDQRIHWEEMLDDEELLITFNRVLLSSSSAWYGVVGAGDRIESLGLFELVQLAINQTNCRFVFSDEDELDEYQSRINPKFKPGVNVELLRSFNYMGRLAIYREDAFRELGGFNLNFYGTEDYDLALSMMAKYGRQAFSHLESVIYHRWPQGSHVVGVDEEELTQRQALVLAKYFKTVNLPVSIEKTDYSFAFLANYTLSNWPGVSVIIPNKNAPVLIKRCIDSLLQHTQYENLEIIIVDNQTTDTETLDYQNDLASKGLAKIISFDEPFHYSRMNNLAVQEAKHDYVLFMNNDAAALDDPHWLQRMVSVASQPDVGAVGPKLQYASGAIQHLGVTLGINNMPADHMWIGSKLEDIKGDYCRAKLPNDVSAVTGACLLVDKQKFIAVGGFNEPNFPIWYNDIDLCLKLGEQGFRNVVLPDIALLHDGSATLSSRTEAEKRSEADNEARTKIFLAGNEAMYNKWYASIAKDPLLNRHISMAERDGSLELDPILTALPVSDGIPKILAMPSDRNGCGLYRIRIPMQAMLSKGVAHGGVTERIYGPTEIMRAAADSIIIQKQIFEHQLDALKWYRTNSNAFMVYELDDLLHEFPDRAVSKFNRMPDINERIIDGIKICDRLVVTTPGLADYYAYLGKETKVVPNFLEHERWGMFVPARRNGKKLRVGWAGGSTHTGDLEVISKVVRKLHQEVDFVFFGLCPEALRPYVSEFYGGVPLDGYPAKLAGLELDLALAPLEQHIFNECKSSLRLLEYGIMGYPVICTDIAPYQGDFPVVRVQNSTDEWVDAIRMYINNPDLCRQHGDELRQFIRENYMIENHLEIWQDAWLA